MTNSDIVKWVYSFVLLGATVWWAKFCVDTVRAALLQPTPIDVLAVAGVSGFLGALVSWNVIVIQHWFRKKSPDKEVSSGK